MAGGMRPKAWMVGLFLFMVYNFGLMVVLHYSGAINDGFLNETSAHEHIAAKWRKAAAEATLKRKQEQARR